MKSHRPHHLITGLLFVSALALSACGEEKKDAKKSEPAPAAAAASDKKPAEAAKPADAPAAKPAEEKKPDAPAAPPAAEKKSEAPAPAPAAAPAEEKKSDTPAAAPAADKKAEAPAATPAAAAPTVAATGDNADVQAAAKTAGAEFKNGRYRNKDGQPQPIVTKDYKVDWATWQGFRRYHDACHVCHGPNAGGSTFAPSLADSLKTMDYETFYGTVVGGRVREAAGTTYVMPAFGEDKNIMCYIDDIYSYIKARSNSVASGGKEGMPAGRPAGREDISEEARKAATECFGEDQTGAGKK